MTVLALLFKSILKLPKWVLLALLPLVAVQASECEQGSDLGGASCDQLKTINYLIYGRSAVPLQIVEDDGGYSGFITDVVNEVFSDSDVVVSPLIMPITRHKVAMVNGKAERWIAYALNSWRKEGVWQGATFADVELLPYTLSLGYKKVSDSSVVDQLSTSLTKQGVSWIQGFKYPGTKEFSERYRFEFQRAKNHIAMLKMVQAGHTKFFMEHAPRMRYVMKGQDVDPSDYGFYSLKDEVPPTSITLLMSNDLGPELIAWINLRLKSMADSGRLQILARAYYL